MINSVHTFTLHAISNRGQGKIDVYQTVFVQGRTATATIALSAFTNGEENGRMGVATAIITKAGVVTTPGRTDTLPLDPIDILRNQIRIPNCSFVTFRMGVQMGEAVAVASVFVEGDELKLSKSIRAAWIVDKRSGRIHGLHKVAFPAGLRLPSERLVARRIRECAAIVAGVEARSIVAVSVARPPSRVQAGLLVDRSTGRVRSPMRAGRTSPSRLDSVLREK